MKKISANKQICQSLKELINTKIKNKEKFLLAKDITYNVDGVFYEYSPNTNGLLNQGYYDRCVNSYLRAGNYGQSTNKNYGMPFTNVSSSARVIYIGEF